MSAGARPARSAVMLTSLTLKRWLVQISSARLRHPAAVLVVEPQRVRPEPDPRHPADDGGKGVKRTKYKAVTTSARPGSPPPQAMPTAATSQTTAAVVSPRNRVPADEDQARADEPHAGHDLAATRDGSR